MRTEVDLLFLGLTLVFIYITSAYVSDASKLKAMCKSFDYHEYELKLDGEHWCIKQSNNLIIHQRLEQLINN